MPTTDTRAALEKVGAALNRVLTLWVSERGMDWNAVDVSLDALAEVRRIVPNFPICARYYDEVERRLAAPPVSAAGEEELRCEKCGGTKVATVYRAIGDTLDGGFGTARSYFERLEKECLRRYCQTCGYKWTDPIAARARPAAWGPFGGSVMHAHPDGSATQHDVTVTCPECPRDARPAAGSAEREAGPWRIVLDPARSGWPGVLLVGNPGLIRVEAGSPTNFADSKALALRILSVIPGDGGAPVAGSAEREGESPEALAELISRLTDASWMRHPDEAEDMMVLRALCGEARVALEDYAALRGEEVQGG